jgi:cell division septation protein DedD
MNINYKETQIDFLTQDPGKRALPAAPRYMDARVSLSSENLVICAIVAIMVVIFSFAMGIERGKSIVAVKAGKPSTENEVVAAQKTQEPRQAPAQGAAVKVSPRPAVEKKNTPDVAGSGAYTLQLASYKSMQPAQREAEQLKKKGFQDVFVLAKGAYTILCVGKFQDKAGATGMKKQLPARYQDPYIRRL